VEWAYILVSLYYVHKRDSAQAMTASQKALELNWANPVARYNYGAALALEGDLRAARAEFNHAIALDRHFAPPHDGLGRALLLDNDLDKAIAEYRRAIEIDQKYDVAYDDLCEALRKKGIADEAIRKCRRSIELNPDSPDSHYDLALTLADQG
jgi:tetratricopeptide (TPR) repeat protein